MLRGFHLLGEFAGWGVLDPPSPGAHGGSMISRKCGWALLAGPACLGTVSWVLHDPGECLDEFMHGDGRFEVENADPLILCWGDITPLVVEAIKDPEMPRRRYAIGFLGEERDVGAVKILRNIAMDSTEISYMRGDALEALTFLARDLGSQLREELSGEGGLLRELAVDPAEDPEVSGAALEALTYLGEDQGFQLAQELSGEGGNLGADAIALLVIKRRLEREDGIGREPGKQLAVRGVLQLPARRSRSRKQAWHGAVRRCFN